MSRARIYRGSPRWAGWEPPPADSEPLPPREEALPRRREPGPAAAGRAAKGVPDADVAKAREAALLQRVAEVTAERDALARKVEELETALRAEGELRRRTEEAWREAAVDLAVAMARRILRRELELDPEDVARLAAEVLSEAGHPGAVVRLVASPEDVALLEGQGGSLAGRLGPGGQVQVVADADLARGDLLVETGAGVWDARLDAQLDELAGAARAAVASHGGEPS